MITCTCALELACFVLIQRTSLLFLRSYRSSSPLLLHAYPRPSKNPPHARSQNRIYHRYIVHTQLDYCNSLFLNIDITQINRLQAFQNALACAVTKTPKHRHITPACLPACLPTCLPACLTLWL